MAPTLSIAPTSAPPPSTAPTPSMLPTASAVPTLTTTPVATTLPTASNDAREITFLSSDGVELHGQLYGSGTTTVILSNMGDNDPGPWQALVPHLLARGYAVLTYSYRYPKNATHFDNQIARQTFEDMRAAIRFVQSTQPAHIVLLGASLGGMVSAKAAAEFQPDALLVLAAPVDLPAFDFRVEPAELQKLSMPKLLIGSENDRNVPFAETERMYDLSPEPKELHSYPSTAHGVQLFSGPHAEDLTRRLIDFITTQVPPAALSATPVQEQAAAADWREDLHVLAEQLRSRHPKPFYRSSEASFNQAVQELDAAIPTMTHNEIVVGFMQIAALIDGHTQMPVWQPDLGFHMYPLRLYWFSDGLYVIDARPPYQDAIGAEVLRIGRLPLDQVATLIDPLAQHDNAMTTRLVAPMFYLMPEVLAARGITDAHTATFTVAYANGQQHTLTPEALSIPDYMAWTLGRLAGLPQRAAPLSLSRRDEAFWLTTLEHEQLVYVQYNQVRATTQSGEALSSFAKRLGSILDTQPIQRVVLDMRHNGGGDNTTYGPLLRLLREHRLFQQPGHLYVIIGRQTFSAATNFVTELERTGMATFVGEATGGSPNLYGDTRPITLPHSKLRVDISARYWQKSTADDKRDALEPDIAVALPSQDFFAGRDPVLAAAMTAP